MGIDGGLEAQGRCTVRYKIYEDQGQLQIIRVKDALNVPGLPVSLFPRNITLKNGNAGC